MNIKHKKNFRPPLQSRKYQLSSPTWQINTLQLGYIQLGDSLSLKHTHPKVTQDPTC